MARQGFDLQLARYDWRVRDLLHDRDGALANERHGHRVGPHAVARDAAGAWEALKKPRAGVERISFEKPCVRSKL
jgi:hypothetical protein